MWPFTRKLPKPVALDPRVVPEAAQAVAERQADPEPRSDRAPIAPWPHIDRWPTILGSNVTLAYISSVFRLCISGYRREFVDCLDELLERDPHMYAVVAQRVHAVAGARVQVLAAETEDGSTDSRRAEEIRKYVEKRIEAIPNFQQAIAQLQWGGVFYGVGCAEINWRKDADGWYPAMLHWIHSRRLAYPDPASWSVRVWDQGMVSSWDVLNDPTGQLFGVKCDDFPGKFIVHAPAVRGSYPTRDGLGRECAYWSALKLMGARGAAQYIERFGKPWVVGYYQTAEKQAESRVADDDDIKALEAAGLALGVGSLANATLPNSTKVDVFGPATSATGRQLFHAQFVTLCNSEMSKAVLGQTDTTEPGQNGSRGAVEVRKEGTKELYRYDATCLADTLGSGLVRWIVTLNFPGEERLTPRILIHAGEEPNLDAIIDRAIKLASNGAEVDADKVMEEAGVPALPRAKGNQSEEGRRLYPMAALKPYEIQSLLKLARGEEVEAPKLTAPTAEAGPGDSTLPKPSTETGEEDASTKKD